MLQDQRALVRRIGVKQLIRVQAVPGEEDLMELDDEGEEIPRLLQYTFACRVVGIELDSKQRFRLLSIQACV